MTVLIGSTGMSRAQDSKDSTSSTAKEEMALPPPSLAEFVHLSSELAENLSELKKTVEKGFDLIDTEKSFAELSQKLQTLTEQSSAVYWPLDVLDVIDSFYYASFTFKINTDGHEFILIKGNLIVVYAVEDRTPRVYPWMNEQILVSAKAEVGSVPKEP